VNGLKWNYRYLTSSECVDIIYGQEHKINPTAVLENDISLQTLREDKELQDWSKEELIYAFLLMQYQ
jgi:hypothetical protein